MYLLWEAKVAEYILVKHTGHLRPVPPKLQFGEHPLDSCLSLLMSVPNQLSADGSRTDHPLRVPVVGGQRDGQAFIPIDPQGVSALAE